MERMTAEELAGLKAVAMAVKDRTWPRIEKAFDMFGSSLEAKFVVAANPSTILRLVEQAGRVEGLEAECQSLSNLVGEQDKALVAMEKAAQVLADRAGESLDYRPEFRRAISAMFSALKAEPTGQLDAPAPPEVAVEQNPWLLVDGLVYRLNEYGVNCDEINVTMANGSRKDVQRNAAAQKLHAMLASPAVPVAAGLPASDELALDKLSAAIMNLSISAPGAIAGADELMHGYKVGHRDARHAAAELVNEFASTSPAPVLPVVPEGYWIAPNEPTDLMLSIADEDVGTTISDGRAYAKALYKEMRALAAAPVLPGNKPQDQSDVMPRFAAPAGQHSANTAPSVSDEAIYALVPNHFDVMGDNGALFYLNGAGPIIKTRFLGFARCAIEAATAAPIPRMGGNTKPSCATCNDLGVVGGHVGQTAESFDYVTEDCPDCPSSPIAEPDTATKAPSESKLAEALRWALEWIDAMPKDTALPAMPGFDRDYVNDLISDQRATQAAAPLTDEKILAMSDDCGVTFTAADGHRESPYQEGFDTTVHVLAFARAIQSHLKGD